ncbi:6-phosphogluconolactonase [Paenibacillus sp. yr247]|uniref:lactonase family protein n=1 Tax=Paenibacillus sp. yr247 TaxID=1761880 RepID=UPI0008882EF4|nr:lactonase family protein [Paenibacillus sp. yr247]SDN53189.1 6-phosphogluconolactonase [Paenibacillus sp. yr247]
MSVGDQRELYCYVGSYTDEQNKNGIHLYAFNPQNGGMKLVEAYTDLPNASFLALNGERTVLYAVSETETYNDCFGGSAAAYVVEAGTGKLKKLNQQPTGGSAPCYISLDQTNRTVFVANYLSGSVTVYPVEADGRLAEATQLAKHEGPLGPRADRQEAPHAHSIVPSPNNRYAISADLGLDRLLVSRIDADCGVLMPHGDAAMKPGAGPRHLVYSADSRYVYAINELDSTVTVLGYEADAGVLTALQSLSTLPEGFSGENTCADIHLSGDARYVYASNRGHDSIAVYGVDRQSGTLSVVGWQATLGRTPRNFALSPQGEFLLAANQDSNSITVFRVDAETGMLHETGQSVAVPRPVCIKFL